MKTSTVERVPMASTTALSRFCSEIDASDGLILHVEPPDWACPNNCYPNSLRMADEFGGSIVTGWKIWHWPRVWFHAVHHCVWLNPSDEMVDVTPNENGAKNVFFARSDGATFDPAVLLLRADIYKPLWNHKKLARLVGLARKRDKLMQNGVNLAKDQTGAFVDSELRSVIDEARELWDWVSRKRK